MYFRALKLGDKIWYVTLPHKEEYYTNSTPNEFSHAR